MWRSLWLLERWPQIKLEIFELYLDDPKLYSHFLVCFSLYHRALWNRRRWLVLLQHLWSHTVPMSSAALSQEQGSLELEHRAAAPEECGC